MFVAGRLNKHYKSQRYSGIPVRPNRSGTNKERCCSHAGKKS
jgi:hypothetical protein